MDFEIEDATRWMRLYPFSYSHSKQRRKDRIINIFHMNIESPTVNTLLPVPNNSLDSRYAWNKVDEA